MELCKLQPRLLTPEEEAERDRARLNPEPQVVSAAHLSVVLHDMGHLRADAPPLTPQKIEAAATRYAYVSRYGSGVPAHGMTRNILTAQVVIDPADFRITGVTVWWEPVTAYEKRIYDYAQECYLTGKTHIVGGSPCGEIGLDGQQVKSSWVWPNEFIPQKATPPARGDSFGFALGKVQAVIGDGEAL